MEETAYCTPKIRVGVVGVRIEGCPFNHILLLLLLLLLDAALPKWRMRMDWKGRDEAKGMLCRPDEYTASRSLTQGFPTLHHMRS